MIIFNKKRDLSHTAYALNAAILERADISHDTDETVVVTSQAKPLVQTSCLLASQYLWLSGWTSNQVGLLRLDTESGGSSPFPPLNTESGGSSPFPPVCESDGSSPFPPVGFTSGGSSPFPPVGYRSDGSSPFPHVGYIWWVFSVSSCRSHRQVGLLHFLL
ncbi:unnamed protein product [Rodentolepis nana]|uniref:Uncharacterized protein n=1 Tax=Rodentolepis nana TaxID=102285 RepID=A0A0R3T4Q0_RODNA|nr:unnamed protein product [Rodentolepis nana]